MSQDAYPKAVIKNSRGEELGTIQLSLDKHLYMLSAEEKSSFQSQMLACIKKMSPATADVFDIVMAHWAQHAKTVNDRVYINVDDVLAYRGKLKKLDGNHRRGGYRPEQREEVARQFQTLAYTFIEAAGTGYDEKRHAKQLKVKCPVIVITGEYSVRDRVTQHLEFMRINYGLGDYFANVMLGNVVEGVRRQVAFLPEPVLQMDPYRHGQVKNMGRYLTHLWKNRQRNGSYCDPIKIRTLIMNGMLWDIENIKPKVVRERFENTMDLLEEMNVIREWKYPPTFDIDTLPRKGWLKEWLSVAIEIEPLGDIVDQYSKIKQKSVNPKDQRQEAHDLLCRLQKKQKSQNLSMNQVAEQLGISASTLSRLSKGITQPRGKTKSKIENWLEN